ncbi:hypothetical protein [Microbacterium sp. 179-I 3D3 NHS]|uniref:hypothetical protein n=1 Tax=Microbacterium sp. 179-I 3D3 NHS TaxID=3142382 RepID=UPI0039A1CCF6
MSTLHQSARTGRWQRCVAKSHCPYGEHRSIPDLARAGGAEIEPSGHGQTQTVSPLLAGGYSVGTGKRTQYYREDGSKLTPKEARVRRNRIQRLLRAAGGASKRAAKRQLKRTMTRAKLRAKWAVQDSSAAILLGIARALEATAEGFQREVDALATEFGDEWELQLAAFEEIMNPPGADC